MSAAPPPAAQDLERVLLLSLIDIHLRRASTDALWSLEANLQAVATINRPERTATARCLTAPHSDGQAHAAPAADPVFPASFSVGCLPPNNGDCLP
jgi:hypothetical protein